MRTALLLSILMLGASPASAADAAPGPGEAVEVLPPIKVKGEVECSFGFAVTMFRNPKTRKVDRLFVGKMSRSSPAAKLGLKPGDEILSLNGKKVRGMDGEAKQGAELFTLLCNRTPGDTVEFEVVLDAQDRVQHLTLKAVKSSRRDKAGDR